MFEVRPEAHGLVDEGVAAEGSLLSGVSAVCGWECDAPSVNSTGEQSVLLQRVHLMFNMEALQLWPLAIRLVVTLSE